MARTGSNSTIKYQLAYYHFNHDFFRHDENRTKLFWAIQWLPHQHHSHGCPKINTAAGSRMQ